MYNIDIEEFQGPLELLSHLIEKNEINIYDIPISEITDQYIEYIEKMKELNLEVTSEFVLIASSLLEIKSRMLLPKEVEEEDPREELVSKLLEYRKYKMVSEQIKDRHDRFSKIYFKLKEDLDSISDDVEIEFDFKLLINSFSKVMKKFDNRINEDDENKAEKLIEDIKRDEFSVDEGMIYIAKALRDRNYIRFESLFDDCSTRYRVITIFMAMLELIKRRDIDVVQETVFGEIIIHKLS